MALQTRPEPMNASPHHSKVKVSLAFGQSLFVAGEHVSGKMEMECRADKGLGIGIIMLELFAIEELTSRDHSATSTFMHSRRLFQGPGLPPSNAVQLHPFAGDPSLPRDYYQARRGISTFLFRFPIPSSAPSAINFGSGLARVKYEVRASVGVAWKGEKRLVTDKKEVDVVESYEEDFGRVEPEGVIIGENGKLWAQGRIVGGVIVGGESACVELQVKNHSNKKNTGLSITLTRHLRLPGISQSEDPPLQISDTLTTVSFRGQEYIIPPGAEGVASLVFDVPKHARGVKGGIREGDAAEAKITEPLFEVQCFVGIKMTMGIGSKDITLDLPVTIVHPSAIPELPAQEQCSPAAPYMYASPIPDVISAPLPPISPAAFLDRAQSPYAYPPLPMSPPLQPYIDQGQMWFPPPTSHTPLPFHMLSPPIAGQRYYFPPPPALAAPYVPPPRPSSAGACPPNTYNTAAQPPLLLLDLGAQQPAEPEEGKGERASRVTHHLHTSSRNRSVSPQSHRFPLAVSHSSPIDVPASTTFRNLAPPVNAGRSPVVSRSQSQGMVHSPRPLVSPKQSFAVDPITPNSLPRSMRVEELERMAEELHAQHKDLSGDIPKPSQEKEGYSDKTLPAPPVPTGKGKLLAPQSDARARAEAIFPIPETAEKAPPTPTLTAVTPSKHPRHGPSRLDRSENGLDALERRLLAEVGTRKIDLAERRPDVRTVLPIGIPQPHRDDEPVLDSAISSLTLADHDSDERTQRAGKSSMSGDDREVQVRRRRERKQAETSPQSKTEREEQREEQRRKGKKKERGRDGEAHKFRKMAKGRVTAWLDEIDPDAPPPETPPSPNISALLADIPVSPRHERSSPKPAAVVHQEPGEPSKDVQQEDVSSAPNPRSSGFVPIGTLKRDPHRVSAFKPPAAADTTEVQGTKPAGIDVRIRALHSSPAPLQTPTPGRVVAPSSTQAVVVNGHGKSTPLPAKPLPTQIDLLARGQRPPGPPTPAKPRLDPEVKYDFRSARGGRGGKVAAVAAIWASATAQNDKVDAPAKNTPHTKPPRPVAKPPFSNAATTASPSLEPPKLVELARKRSKPVIKSMSVPAMVSSSHATPTLSSTASLARVTTAANKNKSPIKLPPTISETPSDLGTPHKAPAAAKPLSGELAFGQARLRDLIKKYQAQPN